MYTEWKIMVMFKPLLFRGYTNQKVCFLFDHSTSKHSLFNNWHSPGRQPKPWNYFLKSTCKCGVELEYVPAQSYLSDCWLDRTCLTDKTAIISTKECCVFLCSFRGRRLIWLGWLSNEILCQWDINTFLLKMSMAWSRIKLTVSKEVFCFMDWYDLSSRFKLRLNLEAFVSYMVLIYEKRLLHFRSKFSPQQSKKENSSLLAKKSSAVPSFCWNNKSQTSDTSQHWKNTAEPLWNYGI